MRRYRVDTTQYLSELRSKQNVMLDTSRDDARLPNLRLDKEEPSAVYPSLELSIDRLKMEDMDAYALLATMAFFDKQSIPRFLIRETVSASWQGSEVQFQECLGRLTAFSLIAENSGDGYSMHRLVEAAEHHWTVDDDSLRGAPNHAADAIYHLFQDIDDWRTLSRFHPHPEALLREHIRPRSDPVRRAKVLCRVAEYKATYGNSESDVDINAHKEAYEVLYASGDRSPSHLLLSGCRD